MFRTAAVLASLCLAQCGSPEEGDPCQLPTCQDKSTALFCDDGRLRAVPCRGPSGCFTQNLGDVLEFVCDVSFNRTGDPCPSTHDGFVLCTSAKTALVCVGQFFHERSCPGSCQPGARGGSCG
jgi:hypothetical protein